jgi:hypothetical protein
MSQSKLSSLLVKRESRVCTYHIICAVYKGRSIFRFAGFTEKYFHFYFGPTEYQNVKPVKLNNLCLSGTHLTQPFEHISPQIYVFDNIILCGLTFSEQLTDLTMAAFLSHRKSQLPKYKTGG